VIDSATLEALACREALALAADLQLTRIKVAMDCLEVTRSREIKAKTPDFVEASFVHER
jgi:hypothetical protein